MKKNFLLFILISVFMLFSNSADAKGQSVDVKIANYNVMLNGTIINNTYYDYPPIVYKGITYFPMTSDFTQALGLTFKWSESEGITVDKNETSSEVNQTFLNSDNDRSTNYKATIVTDRIRVNGKEINNITAEYPVLEFRQVTYFPMTWNLISDEFGWQTNWTDGKGLSVSSDPRFSLDIKIEIIGQGFINEGTDTIYYVRFSDGFLIALSSDKLKPFDTKEAVAILVSRGNSSISKQLSIIGFNDTFGEDFYPLAFSSYIPSYFDNNIKSIYRSEDFFEKLKNYNGKSNILGGMLVYDSFVLLEGVYFDDGIHQCNLYIAR